MPQIDFDGANSLVKTDKIQGQSGTTVTVPTSHTLAITDADRLTIAGTAVKAGALGGLVFLASATASASAAIEFTSGITSTYSNYVFMLKNVRPATNAQDFYFQVSSDGGSSWLTGYYGACAGYDGSVTLRSAGFTAASYFTLADSVHNGTGIGVGGPLYLIDPSDANTLPLIRWDFVTITSIGSVYAMGQSGGGNRNSAAAVNAVRFSFASGNIADGEIRMYGIKDS